MEKKCNKNVYKKKGSHLAFLIFLSLYCFVSYAQERTITGTITSPDGEPLPGVNVVVQGTNNGVSADFDGNYSITIVSDISVLVFSYLGFSTQEITVGNQNTINVTLKENTSELDEVVVIGYGTVKKSDLTGSVSSLELEDLNKVPVASINQSLAGRSSGINVTSESGAPGAGVKIRIRGTNSLQGDNNPLYVIDGVPIATSISQGGNFSADALAGINPNDIESLEILKDASAVAIYGSRGANGVVLITTKSGKVGKTKIAIDRYYGIQSEIKSYDVLNAEEFAKYRNDAVNNVGSPNGVLSYSEEEIQEFRNGAGTDWRSAVLRNAPIQNTQISFSGGSDKIQYYVSGAHFDQEGIVRESGFNRSSVKASLNFEVSDRFKIGSDLTLSQSKYKGDFGNSQNGSFGGGYIDVYYAPPTLPVRDAEGEYLHNSPLTAFPFPNPVENALEVTRDQTNLRALGNIFGTYDIFESLQLKILLGMDYSSDNIREYAPIFTQRSNFQGSASQSHRLSKSLLSTTTLSYNNTFVEKHNLNGVLGYEIQTSENQLFVGSSRQFSNNITGYYSLESGEEISNLNSDFSETGLQSLLGRINYNYDNRYFITFTGRYDGSSKFQGDNRYSFFPSAALAWRVSNEKFLKNAENISDLKIRASYGETGSQAIPPYRTLDLISASNIITINGSNTTLGYFPVRIPSPGLTWETTKQYDGGIDLGLFSGKLALTADYFYKKTEDLLLDFSVPFTSGFNSFLQNRGSMENKGFEFSIDSRNVTHENFNWSTDFNISFIKNKVLDLGGRDFVINTPNISRAFGTGSDFNGGITKVGEPLGTFFVLQEDGIIDNEEELNDAPSYSGMAVGTRRYVDINGDNQITADDRAISGNAQPDFTGGLLNSFTFNNFDLSFFFEFTYGNEVLNATRYTLERPSGDFNITREFFENYWRGDGTSESYPAPIIEGVLLAPSNSYIEDGSFARLTNLTLGYSLPKQVIERLNISLLRFYVNANNIWTITNYTGLDPSTSVFGDNEYGAGIDYSAYPTAKSFVLGVSLEF